MRFKYVASCFQPCLDTTFENVNNAIENMTLKILNFSFVSFSTYHHENVQIFVQCLLITSEMSCKKR